MTNTLKYHIFGGILILAAVGLTTYIFIDVFSTLALLSAGTGGIAGLAVMGVLALGCIVLGIYLLVGL